MTFIRRLPIRLRLALAFAVVMACVLAATGGFVYVRLARDLDNGIGQALDAKAGDVSRLAQSADGQEQLTRQIGEAGETFAQVLAPDGRLVASPVDLRSQPLLTPTELRRAGRKVVRIGRAHLRAVDEPVRLLARPVVAQGRRVVVVVGTTLDDRDEALSSLATLLLIGGPAALLLASLAGYAVTAAALRPVESMRRTAAEVSVAQPGKRLPVPRARDEIARLGETLNEMLGRQEAAFERERAFVSDASHELRTPLAILRTELELALRGDRSTAELDAAVRSAAEETDRLSQLAEDLLVTARFEDGQLPVQPQAVSAAELVARVRDRYAQRALASGREIRVEAPADSKLFADPVRLEQALGNLVENALRHGAGEIELVVESDGAETRLHVRDRGPGFAPAFLPKAFQRFSRGDPGRTAGGAGLGLAIVHAIAHAHGGSCSAINRDGGGAQVSISLPAHSWPSHPARLNNVASHPPQEESQ